MATTMAKTPGWPESIDRFAAHLESEERSEHTRRNYREDLAAFAAWFREHYKEEPRLGDLAAAELREWKSHLRETRKLEPATVNRKLAALRSFLRWAESAGLAAEVAAPRSIRQVRPAPRWL